MSRRLLVMLSVVLLGAAAVSCGRSDSIAQPSRTLPPGTVPGSVAGQPCVAAAADVPVVEGKPKVEIPVGPPPAELVKTDLKVGDGEEVKAESTLKVQYVGLSCSTGKQFDSSWDKTPPDPATFPLNQVIAGWTQGLLGMKVGGQRMLVIPPALGYGAKGSPPDIAPGETLVFVVDLVGIEAAAAGTTVPTPTDAPGTTVAGTPGSTPGSTP